MGFDQVIRRGWRPEAGFCGGGKDGRIGRLMDGYCPTGRAGTGHRCCLRPRPADAVDGRWITDVLQPCPEIGSESDFSQRCRHPHGQDRQRARASGTRRRLGPTIDRSLARSALTPGAAEVAHGSALCPCNSRYSRIGEQACLAISALGLEGRVRDLGGLHLCDLTRVGSSAISIGWPRHGEVLPFRCRTQPATNSGRPVQCHTRLGRMALPQIRRLGDVNRSTQSMPGPVPILLERRDLHFRRCRGSSPYGPGMLAVVDSDLRLSRTSPHR